MKRTVLLLTIVALAGCLIVGGCNKFSRSRYESIHAGINKLTVEKILGPPSAKFSDSWTYTPDEIKENEDYYYVTIHFADDRVTQKTWSDKHGIADNPDGKKPIGPPKITID